MNLKIGELAQGDFPLSIMCLSMTLHRFGCRTAKQTTDSFLLLSLGGVTDSCPNF